MKTLTTALLIALALPAQEKPGELERLRKEAQDLEQQIERELTIEAERARVDKLRRDLRQAKKDPAKLLEERKAAAKKQAPKPAAGKVEIRPRYRPPNMKPGEITVVECDEKRWWFYELRPGGGEVSVHEFKTEKLAMDFVKHVIGSREDFTFVPLSDLKKRS